MRRFLITVVGVFSLFYRVCCDDFQETLGHLKPQTSEEIQSQAAFDLIKRLISNRASEFHIIVNKNLGPTGKDTFQITKNDDIIYITATSGVAAALGFHYYLKYFCSAHISWETTQLNLPDKLPNVNITITSNDRFRYYQNVCTTSYSFVWWKWEDWEKHIDWMALNGINLALAFNGQEAIWAKVYQKFNLTQDEINEHFSGPAFLSWLRMGNLRGWGGPLSEPWHSKSSLLQHQILKRMRSLGIIPVLPAFAGHVPLAFKRLFPEARLTKMQSWNNFEDKYCCPYLLDPTDPLFNTIGKTFMQEQILEYGTDHIYNCDTFNEMVPSSTDPIFLRNVSKSIYSAMTSVDPQAIWMLQGWIFISEFWNTELANAFLTAIPLGKMIVLDLQSEQFPQYERLDSYFGQPFIWCMLHNFGGTLGMFGSAERINNEVFKGRNFKNSTMIGTGLTPEGINQNYVIYDLMAEMFWRKSPANLSNWFNLYAVRRYGNEDENATMAWQIFRRTVYDFNSLEKMRGKYVISRSPKLNLKTSFWYNIEDFMLAWDYLLKASANLEKNTGYRHDLVDVTRQVLQIMGDLYYPDLIKAFKKKQVEKFQFLKLLYSQLFKDLDLILASNDAFLLGRWLESAKSLASNPQERRLLEYNARNQISLWGPRGEIKDYANKQWAGVVSHLFEPRWGYFLSAMNDSLVTGQPFNESSVASCVFSKIEAPFTTDTEVFTVNATGDSVEIAKDIHVRWRNRTKISTRQRRRGRGRVHRSSEEIVGPHVIHI